MSGSPLPRQRLLVAGVFGVLGAAALAGLTPVVFGTPRPMVHVTWREIDPPQQRTLEQQFKLSEPSYLAETTWAYVPLDVSSGNLRAIVGHRSVADTDGIDRKALTIARHPPLTPRRGGLWAGAPRGAARVALLMATAVGVLGVGALVVSVVAYSGLTTHRARKVARAGLALPRAAAARLTPTSPLVSLLLVASVVAFRFLSFDYVTNDHFMYLTFAHQTALGELPVRDYDDPGFPMMIALSAAAMRLGGMSLLPEVLLTASMLAIAAWITFRAAWLASGMPGLALLATALQVIAYPRPYSYPKILVTACAAWLFFAYAHRPTRAFLASLAVLTEVALLLRHDLAVYVSFATGLLLFFVHGPTRLAVRRIALYAALCALLTIPYAAYLLTFGIDAHLAAVLSFSRSEALRTGEWSTVLTSGSLLTLALVLLPIAAGMWLVVRRWRNGRWDEDAPEVAATVILMAMVNAGMLRDRTPARLADVFGPAPVLVAWIGARAIRALAAARTRSMRVLGATCLAAAGIAAVVATAQFGALRHHLAEARLDEWGSLPGHAQRQAALLREWPWTGKYQGISHEPLARYLDACTDPRQSVLIVGYLPHLPVIARRPFAGGHAWLLPGYFSTASDQSRMSKRLAEHPPAVVIIAPADATDVDRDWPSVAQLWPQYREGQEFQGLYVRTARNLLVRGSHSQTGLDCLR